MAEELMFNEEYEKLTTGTRAHADKFNKIFDLLMENDKFLKYAAESLVANKISIFIGETLPPFEERSENTIYYRIIQKLDTGLVTENIKVSPKMGIKLVNN